MTTNSFGMDICDICGDILLDDKENVSIPRCAEGYTETICYICAREIARRVEEGCPE